MPRCPQCSSLDLDPVQRLGGSAMILKCLQCGHQWQRGTPPEPAVPGQTVDQRLRAKFPSSGDIEEVGRGQFAVEDAVEDLGEETFLAQLKDAIEYLLYYERRDLEQRFT